MNLSRLILILNWLFILFPISIIIGNSAINLHFVIFILFGCVYLIKKNIKLEYNFLILVFFSFCIILIISSLSNQFNISKSFLYLRFLVFYYICFYLLKEKIFKLDRIFHYYAIFVTVISFDLIIQYIFGYNIVGLKINELGPTSFFQHEKIAGSFIQNFGFYLIFVIFSKFYKNNFYNIVLKSFLISLVSISIFISFQRIPMMIWMLFLLIYGFIYYKSKLMPVLLSFAILALFVSNFSSKEIKESYISFYDNASVIGSRTFKNYNTIKDKKLFEEIKKDPVKATSFESGSGHASLYANAFYVWEDNKFFGVGYKNFYNECIKKKLTRCITHPHNYYLDVLVSTGLVGLIILIIYLVKLFLDVIYNLRINIKKKLQTKFDILIISFINFLMFFFPFKSSGSFFTTASSTYMLIMLVILLSQLQIKSSKKIY